MLTGLTGLDNDDHTQYLLANGVRNAINGFAVTGTFGDGVIPAEDPGVRLMWYPRRAAFRAGRVTGEQWNNANIGVQSTAMGANTTASGDRSTAMGAGTISATERSLSTGRWNSANSDPDDNTVFVVGNGTSDANRSDALVLDFAGNLSIAGNYLQHSDRRLKRGITPLGDGVLGKLGGIRPVYYRFKEETGHPTDPQLGLIAQEVQVHFPELVSEGNDGFLSLSYPNFTAVLLKGVQEQQEEIERLRAEVRRIDRLETQLAGLQAALHRKTPPPAIPVNTAGLGLLVLFLLSGGVVLYRRRAG